MYKGASQKAQHRLGVDRPHPSRGFIDGGSDALDVLPDVAALSVERCRDEQAQLRREIARLDQELAVAKTVRRKDEAAAIGQQKAAVSLRLAAINRHLRSIDGDSELFRLRTAVREIAGNELAEQIFEHARSLRGKVHAPRDSGSDPQGENAERSGAVEGEASQSGPKGIAQKAQP